MGCPPSPEEKDMGRYGSMIDNAINKYQTLKPQYLRFFELIEQLRQKQLTPEQNDQLQIICRMNIINTVTPTYMNPNPTGTDDEFYSWLSSYGSCAYSNEEKVKQLEITLCNARCNFYNFLRNPKPDLDEKETKEIEFQVKEYAEHREEDRQTWIAWLKSELKYGKYYLDEEDKGRKEMAEYATAVIQAEIEKTESYSEEEMMRDCFLFGRDSEKFCFITLLNGGKRA